MNEKQRDIAQKALCEWLSEQDEMDGKPPKKIGFAFAIRDDRNGDRI